MRFWRPRSPLSTRSPSFARKSAPMSMTWRKGWASTTESGGSSSIPIPEPRPLLPTVEFGTDAYDTASGCDALVLATEWNQFRSLDLRRLKTLMKSPVLVDLRNVYEPVDMKRLGFRYAGVGR